MLLTSRLVIVGSMRIAPLGLVLALVVLASACGMAAADTPLLKNASFEASGAGTTCQSIVGWTIYGAPVSSISVVEDGQRPALRISRGKAFSYGLAVDPEVDYRLSVRVRANQARVLIEAEPPLPDQSQSQGLDTTFDWKTIEIPLPAEQRASGTREMWIAVGAEPTAVGGAAWFQSVTLEPMGGGPDAITNASFEEPVVQTTVPSDWTMDSGGARLAVDRDQVHDGTQSLRLTGVNRPVRISQPFDLKSLSDRDVKRVRISAWGRSRGLGSDRVRLEVYGSLPPIGPILSLSGDAEWMKGEVVLDVERQQGRKLAIWLHAPRPFEGDAWFDDIRIDPVPADEVVNLLPNASFHPSIANPRLPDHWGLWGDAVWCIEPWSLDYFGLADIPGPFTGTRVLQIWHPDPKRFVPLPNSKRLNMFVLTGASLDLPQCDYTFSIYVKAERPNTTVQIRHPASAAPLATAKVGPKWQRMVATSDNVELLPAIHVPDPGSRVWLAAPQLEPGRVATDFRVSPGDGSVAPPGPLSGTSNLSRDQSRAGDRVTPAAAASPLAVYAEFDHVIDDETVRGRLKWTGTTPATVHWRLLDAITGKKLPVAQQSVLIEEPGTHTFVIATADLPLGGIGIQAVADSGGKRVGRANDAFAKLGRSEADVRVSRFNRSVAVDGRPILPVFLPVEPETLGDWHLDRLAKAGFNCLAAAPGKLQQRDLMSGAVPLPKAEGIRRQLDRMHARGMKLLWPIPWTFSDWSRTGELYGGDVSRLAATYQTLVSAFRHHPAILGWYLMDEPSPQVWEKEYGFAESDLRRLWLAVKEADPVRPAYVNWNHTWAIAPYGGIDCTDVVGHDNYVISAEPFDYGDLVPSVRMVNDARAGRKPAFAWISGSYDESAMRPTPDAIRVHAWLHLVYGTRGLGYWSKPPLDPQAWAEIKAINHEAAALHANVLGRPEAILREVGSNGSPIHHALWIVGNVGYLIAVNTSSCAQVLELDVGMAFGRQVVAARTLVEDREVHMEAASLREECAPFSRHLYKFTLAETSH